MERKSRHFLNVTERGAGGMEHVQSGRVGYLGKQILRTSWVDTRKEAIDGTKAPKSRLVVWKTKKRRLY